MMKLGVAVLGVLVSVATARADGIAERFHVEGTAGVNTPLGFGVIVDAAITPWLAVEAGTGVAFSLTGFGYHVALYRDVQLAAGARVHASVERLGLDVGAGLGLSRGAHRRFDIPVAIPGDDTQEWHAARWANAELFVRSRGRLYARGFFGAGALLNREDCRNYHDQECMQETPVGRIFGGVGVGYGF